VDHNGSFSFRNLEPGRYTLILDSGKEYETITESVYIDDMRTKLGGPGPPPRVYNLPIYLQPKRETSAKVGSGIIDARLSDIPARSRTLYQKALESEKKGDINKAIEELQQAVSLHPAFVLALNELGVQYLKLAQLDKAVESLRAAIKLAPEEFGPRLNYGIALLNQRKFADAESQFRTALKIKDSVPTAHMYLGIALGAQRKLAEAEKELLIAVSSKSVETARAHRYLGGIYLETHDYKRAADELEIYLKLMPNTQDAAQTRATIKECRRKS
jgi:tetratricopeptide (TPR) repeat protein